MLTEDRVAQSIDPTAGDEPPRWRQPKGSRRLLNIVTIVITLLFSYFALRSIDLSLAWRSLRTSDYWWLTASLAAFALGNLARALRWRSLFAHSRRPDLRVVINAMMVGYLYNNILPARAGEAARIVVLTQRSTAAPVEIVGTAVLERLYDVLAILMIFFAAETWLPHVTWFGAAATAAIVVALFITAAAAVLAIYGDRPLRLLVRPLGRLSLFSGERLERTISELTHGLSGLRNARLAFEASAWTIIAWLLTALCAYFVSLAFHLHVPFACGVLVSVAIGLGMILPSPPAAVGVFEGAALIALSAYGIPHSDALPFAVVLHLVNFIPFVAIGAMAVHYNTRHPLSVSSQASAASSASPL